MLAIGRDSGLCEQRPLRKPCRDGWSYHREGFASRAAMLMTCGVALCSGRCSSSAEGSGLCEQRPLQKPRQDGRPCHGERFAPRAALLPQAPSPCPLPRGERVTAGGAALLPEGLKIPPVPPLQRGERRTAPQHSLPFVLLPCLPYLSVNAPFFSPRPPRLRVNLFLE
jgi:hypothetical protein